MEDDEKMKGYDILKAFDLHGKYLAPSTLYNYVRWGVVPMPINGSVTNLQSEYPLGSAGEAYAAMMLFRHKPDPDQFARLGPSEIRMVRTIGELILEAGYKDPWDATKDPELRKLVGGRPFPAFFAIEWLRLFFEFELNGQLPEGFPDLNKLRIVLLDIAQDRGAIEERNRELFKALERSPDGSENPGG